MTKRRTLHVALALLAAYAIALQSMLLSIVAPGAWVADAFGTSICAPSRTAHDVPSPASGHHHDCLAACLAAGSATAATLGNATPALKLRWGRGRTIALALDQAPAAQRFIAKAYESRAPPLG